MRGIGVVVCSCVFVLLLASFFSFIPQIEAQSSPILKFDQQKIVVEHKDVITLIDSNPTSSKVVTLKSFNSVGAQIDIRNVTLLEVVPGQYRIMIKFTTATTSDPLEIKVIVGGTVTVTRGTENATANITDGAGTQVWGVRRYDNTWSNCSGTDDIDNDGVCKNWETFTPPDLRISYPPGSTTYDVDCTSFMDHSSIPCSGEDMRDIYVEIDYMVGHRPNAEAIRQVVNAFTNAPSQGGSAGIRLHIQLDDGDANQIFHNACTIFPGLPFSGKQGFDQIKGKYFGTAEERAQPGWDAIGWKQKKQVFHYVLFVHSQCGSTGSGTAELFGNDVLITLGSFDGQIGSPDQQAGTLMHELGHNINLNHGGKWNDTINCKPNHLSVMSYSRQFSDLVSDRALDYSRQILGNSEPTMVKENQPSESAGITSYTSNPSERITWGPTPPLDPPSTSAACINWNLNGNECELSIPTTDLNQINSEGTTICSSGVTEDLIGNKDWDDVNLNSRGSGNWADGRSAKPGFRVASWELSSTLPSEMIPSFFCPPPEQILMEAPVSSTIEQKKIHLNNYRTCVGGVGENNNENICLAYTGAILLSINSTWPEYFKNPVYNSDLEKAWKNIEDNCINGKFNESVNELNSLLLKLDEDKIGKTDKIKTENIKFATKILSEIDQIESIKSSNEIKSEDVQIMRLSRIDSIDKFLNNLNETDFKNGKKTFLANLEPKLKSVRDDVKNNKMESAVGTLLSIKYDEITNKIKAQELESGIKDIAKSYSISYAVPEFNTIATLILIVSIISVIILSKKTKYNLINMNITSNR